MAGRVPKTTINITAEEEYPVPSVETSRARYALPVPTATLTRYRKAKREFEYAEKALLKAWEKAGGEWP